MRLWFWTAACAVAAVVSAGAQSTSTVIISGQCSEMQIAAVAKVSDELGRGEEQAATRTMRALPGGRESCTLVELMRRAEDGWREARALAAVGGSVERLVPVRQALADLDQLMPARPASPAERPGLALLVEYAQTLVHAAVAAAQDERPEMSLRLDHARDLVRRLEERGERAEWPRPYNLAAGELWFEVDRYDEARLAFERAVQVSPTHTALVGLARSLSRLGRQDEACATVRRVADLSTELKTRAHAEIGRCR